MCKQSPACLSCFDSTVILLRQRQARETCNHFTIWAQGKMDRDLRIVAQSLSLRAR